MENFIDVIADRSVPMMPPAESVRNAIAMQAMVTAAGQGRPVDIELPGFAAQALPDYLAD